jgi:hypothetical protein
MSSSLSTNKTRVLVALLSLTALLSIFSISLAARAIAGNAKASIPGPAEVREMFVFQVGIDKYKYASHLDGCVQDVTEMKQLLMSKKFNVPADHFLTLTNEQGTHTAIIDGFRKHLIEKAKTHRNAIFIFQYSGHGSQVKDQNGDKADNLDSTLVPVGSRDPQRKEFDIVDDEIRALFDELSQYSSNVVFIIDACHSGNPTRGGGKTRGIPMDSRPQPAEQTNPPANNGARLRGQDLTAMLPRDLKYVSIAATKSNELANEMPIPDTDKTYGALTFYLLRALEKAGPETSYDSLMNEVKNNVATRYPQHPQIEGDIGRPVFAGAATREDASIKILDVQGDTITIALGAAQGYAVGTVVALYASDPRTLFMINNAKKLTTGTVTEVTGPFTSRVKLDATEGVTVEAKVVVVSPDFGSTTTRVAFAQDLSHSPNADMKAKLMDLFIDKRTGKPIRPSLIVVGDVDLDLPRQTSVNWDTIVKLTKFSDSFQRASSQTGGANSRSADRQVYIIAGPDGTRPLFDYFVELDDSEGPQKIFTAIERWANQRSLRAINNQASKLNGGIKINVLRVRGDLPRRIEGEEEVKLAPNVQDYSSDQNEWYRFEIVNQSTEDLYVTFFDIGTNGSIKVAYPPPGGMARIPHGARVKPPFVTRLTSPPGYETFKIIASTEDPGPNAFLFLEQAGVRLRGDIYSIANLPDWTTAEVSFVISDKVKP